MNPFEVAMEVYPLGKHPAVQKFVRASQSINIQLPPVAFFFERVMHSATAEDLEILGNLTLAMMEAFAVVPPVNPSLAQIANFAGFLVERFGSIQCLRSDDHCRLLFQAVVRCIQYSKYLNDKKELESEKSNDDNSKLEGDAENGDETCKEEDEEETIDENGVEDKAQEDEEKEDEREDVTKEEDGGENKEEEEKEDDEEEEEKKMNTDESIDHMNDAMNDLCPPMMAFFSPKIALFKQLRNEFNHVVNLAQQKKTALVPGMMREILLQPIHEKFLFAFVNVDNDPNKIETARKAIVTSVTDNRRLVFLMREKLKSAKPLGSKLEMSAWTALRDRSVQKMASPHRIFQEGIPADIPLLDGYRVVLYHMGQISRGWNADPTFGKIREIVEMDSVSLSAEECVEWTNRMLNSSMEEYVLGVRHQMRRGGMDDLGEEAIAKAQQG
mmetsp:Transcript_3088/g.4541  ORF Transcript_3088/g.4541 Transcript_3088/m.4541 type:complete len:442 (+) Transcript_3088:752-2077(+)